MNSIFLLVGRLFLCSLFAFTALNHALDLGGAQTYLTSRGIPMAGVFVVISILLRLVGVGCIAFGYRTKFGVASLLLFLVFSTVIFYTPFLGMVPITPLLKNMGLMGGLLILAASGPGSISLKRQ